MTYRLLSYRSGTRDEGAVLVHDRVVPLANALDRPGPVSVLDALFDWDAVRPRLEALASAPAASLSSMGEGLDPTRLLAPILYPGNIYAAGANYHDHVGEMFDKLGISREAAERPEGDRPYFFVKSSRSAVVGPGAVVELPRYSQKVDWEVELAVVIGRAARRVSAADALDYVAGYTIANDLSARDASRRSGVAIESPFYWDRVTSKCFEGACPMGPWIVPAHDLDPANAGLRLWVNDALMQDSNTRYMTFSVAQQIEALSEIMTLQPGDVILTGTPDGVGMGRGVFLQPGDRVRLEIDGIGSFSHGLS